MVHQKVINAKGFVPQNRERVYIVCFEKSKVKDPNEFKWPNEPDPFSKTISDILETDMS